MKQKKLLKKEAKKLSSIVKELSYQVPFTTNLQEEVQQIVKKLWEKQESFEPKYFNVSWLNETPIKIENNLPTILLYSTMGKNENGNIVYNCDDEEYIENGFKIKIMNMENFSPYGSETVKLNILGTDNDDLKGIALVAIMDLLYYDIRRISDLHKKIIDMYNSNLDEKNKKSCISSIIDEINEHIEDDKNKFNFIYQYEVIRDLNDLHLYHEWIEEGDSYVIQIALEYYQEIAYYNIWLEKHGVDSKHFKDKVYALNENYQEIIEYFDMKAPYKRKVPRHPQEILHDLVDRYIDAYGDERNIYDDGVQAIIRIISDYLRMPKKSKTRKVMEAYNNETSQMVEMMRQKGASNEEMHGFIIERAFGKMVTYVGDNEKE